MKKKVLEGKVVLYGFADPEGAKERRKYKASIIKDKKKEQAKKRCRNGKYE